MSQIIRDAVFTSTVLLLLRAAYSIAFSGRFTSWREGRRASREMASLRKKRHA
jgi:hypothetical protein